MGVQVTKLCTQCFQVEEDSSIPLIETTKSEITSSTPTLTEESLDSRVEENHPMQSHLFKLIENASIEFLSHIRCQFEEEGFNELLKKDKIRVLTKDCENGYTLKSEYFLQCTAEQFIELLKDVKSRKMWDENIEKIEVVLTLPEETSVVYIKYKKFLIISSRDAVVVSRIMRAHKGIAYISTSCEHEDYPENEGTVRARVETAGYYIEPQENGRCRVVGFSIGDAGGNLPKNIVKTVAASALPKFIASVEKAIKAEICRKSVT